MEAMLAPVPTPIGVGPQYHPRPAMHAACAGATGDRSMRMHLELFANGRVVIVPARVGVRSAGCRAHVWTLAPTGVVRFVGRRTLGDLFAVWGMPLTGVRLLGFHGEVRVYVDGVRRRGDPRALVLRRHAEVVLEVGGYVPPHRSYLFPPD
ncbi:MAG TPA: hypothetical protein VFA30_05590 [Gaiellaceae bacterium]|nr:hypothetical protein [Gaiellaceae bacterium]